MSTTALDISVVLPVDKREMDFINKNNSVWKVVFMIRKDFGMSPNIVNGKHASRNNINTNDWYQQVRNLLSSPNIEDQSDAEPAVLAR